MTFVGAGDIANGDNDYDEATASLLDAIPGTVFTLGDTVYPNGSAADFANHFAPTWGRHKARIIPAVGNHEYQTANAAGYYSYFGAAAGDPTKGYYSKDLGAWHVIVLNGNCDIISCAAGSAQEQWLRGGPRGEHLAVHRRDVAPAALLVRFPARQQRVARADLGRALPVQRRPRAQRP